VSEWASPNSPPPHAPHRCLSLGGGESGAAFGEAPLILRAPKSWVCKNFSGFFFKTRKVSVCFLHGFWQATARCEMKNMLCDWWKMGLWNLDSRKFSWQKKLVLI
jgi:hypothetical protein